MLVKRSDWQNKPADIKTPGLGLKDGRVKAAAGTPSQTTSAIVHILLRMEHWPPVFGAPTILFVSFSYGGQRNWHVHHHVITIRTCRQVTHMEATKQKACASRAGDQLFHTFFSGVTHWYDNFIISMFIIRVSWRRVCFWSTSPPFLESWPKLF